MWLHHFVAGGQVEPDLKQLQRIGFVGVHQRKHLAVHDALAGCEPLHIAVAKTCGCPQRVAVVYQTLTGDGHGLKTPVRVRREAGNGVTVVHAPAILAGKVLADAPPGQRCRRSHGGIPQRVGIVVVHTKQKRVQGLPRKAQWLQAEDGGCWSGGSHVTDFHCY